MTYEFDTMHEAVRHLRDKSAGDDRYILFLLDKILMSMHSKAHGDEDDHAMFISCHKEVRELYDFLH